MKHYKTPGNEIYAFEDDGSQDELIREDMVLLSDADLADVRAQQAAAAAAAFVPQAVTMRQARLALLAAGLLSQVSAAVAAAPEATQIEWEFAATVERTSPLVVTLSAALGLSDSLLDDLFRNAANI